MIALQVVPACCSTNRSKGVCSFALLARCGTTLRQTGSIPGVCDEDKWFHRVMEATDKPDKSPLDALVERNATAGDQPPAVTFVSKKSLQAAKYVPRAGWALGLGLFGLVPIYFLIVPAIAAIVLGWQGRKAYVKSGKVLRRNTMATVGLVLGVAGIVVNGGLFAFNQLKSDSADRPNVLEIIDCAELHRSEAISRVALVGEEYPGADAVEEQAFDLCFADFDRIVGTDPADSVYSVEVYTPSPGQWSTSKLVTCAVTLSNGESFTGSVVGQ
jgi:hypothetical protein